DRSAAGIRRTEARCRDEIAAGLVSTLCAPVEGFGLPDGMPPIDLALACRVGALDGRHPALYAPALRNLRRAVVPGGSLWVDTGCPRTRVRLDDGQGVDGCRRGRPRGASACGCLAVRSALEARRPPGGGRRASRVRARAAVSDSSGCVGGR